MNINSVVLTGNLTKDVEMAYTPKGQARAIMLLAVDRPYREDQQQTADFPRIVAWGKLAENCGQYLRKGSPIAVQGRIQTGKYEDKDGKVIYTTDVTASAIQFLKERREEREIELEKPDDFLTINEEVPF